MLNAEIVQVDPSDGISLLTCSVSGVCTTFLLLLIIPVVTAELIQLSGAHSEQLWTLLEKAEVFNSPTSCSSSI